MIQQKYSLISVANTKKAKSGIPPNSDSEVKPFHFTNHMGSQNKR